MINKKVTLIAIIAFLFGLASVYFYAQQKTPTSNINQRVEKMTVESEAQAVRLVTDRAKDEKVNDYWVTSPCVFVASGTRDDNFLVEFHDKHNERDCPGDPLTQPLIASFSISKVDGAITWYDVINDKDVPFDDYVRRLKFKK